MMPKMDGWQVCREIRVNSKVPIIMLTARGDERDELQGFQLGVDEYISKPLQPQDPGGAGGSDPTQDEPVRAGRSTDLRQDHCG